MPKCGACGKNYDNANVMELVRNQENRWISICRHCLEEGVDVNALKPGTIAVENHALQAGEHPAIDVTLSPNVLENARNLLTALRNLRQNKERVGRARSHERKHVDLTVYFTMARDDARHQGQVKDFSQSGLRVVTQQQLTVGQMVQFDWNIPLPPSMSRMLQNTAEVRRVTKNEDGAFDIGFKFMSRHIDKGINRRRFRRYRCDMLVYYQRQNSAVMSRGNVTDISQGGCQMRLDEKLDSGESFMVRLVGGGGSRGDMIGSMRVCRVIPRETQFETGCAFEKMRIEQQPALTDASRPAAQPAPRKQG